MYMCEKERESYSCCYCGKVMRTPICILFFDIVNFTIVFIRSRLRFENRLEYLDSDYILYIIYTNTQILSSKVVFIIGT